MAVVSSFTASKLVDLIPPSEAIQFTDTSTGSPDSWLWDFGDGSFSEEQSPLHTYTGEIGDQFIVKLTAYIAGVGVQIGGGGGGQTRGPAVDITSNQGAYDIWLTQSWGNNTPEVTAFMAQPAGGGAGAAYLGGRKDIVTTIPSVTSVTVGMFAEYKLTDFDANMNRTITEQHGSFYFQIGGDTLATISGIGPTGSWAQGANIITFAGQSITLSIDPNHALITPLLGTGLQKGHMTYSRMYHYVADDPANLDSQEQTIEFISSENSYIDFVGTPLSGTSPLAVQFTDLSVVSHALSVWEFGDGNSVTVAGETHPLNTYTTDSCSLDLL